MQIIKKNFFQSLYFSHALQYDFVKLHKLTVLNGYIMVLGAVHLRVFDDCPVPISQMGAFVHALKSIELLWEESFKLMSNVANYST